MKRCPTCNRTFEEEWLAFCTQDGTTLVEDSPKVDLQATMMAPPPQPTGGWKPPSGDLGSGGFQAQPAPPPSSSPSGGFGSPQYQQPQQMQGGWQPPPPPYAPAPKQGLAVASLAVGIFSITIGWCYMGIVSGPIAAALGIAALVQAKNKPDEYGGKPLAIVGIITGAIPFVVLLLFFVLAVGLQAFK